MRNFILLVIALAFIVGAAFMLTGAAIKAGDGFSDDVKAMLLIGGMLLLVGVLLILAIARQRKAAIRDWRDDGSDSLMAGIIGGLAASDTLADDDFDTGPDIDFSDDFDD